MKYDHKYFAGKTAVVTGGAGGIGLALVEELLESDAAKVVMADIDGDALDAQEARLDVAWPGRVKGIRCDVTDEGQVQGMVSQALGFFGGRIDLLFNNAGATFFDLFEETTNDGWESAFSLNFYSALYGVRAVLPTMRKQGGGQIVNIISGVAFMPMAYWSRYSATKAALNAATMVMRAEFWDDNIKVSAATPGTTATNIFKAAGKDTPETAQSPHDSASRILNGVTRNERIIFGDDADASGAKTGYNNKKQGYFDKYLLRVARERREGKTSI